jgi:hypothetical protein
MKGVGLKKTSLVLIAVLTGGCASATFVRTDEGFRPLMTRTLPEVYLDRVPERPYRAVGVIEVIVNGKLPEIVKIARETGQKFGCDAVIDRPLHRASSTRPELPRLVAAQYPAPPVYVAPPKPYQPPPPVYLPQQPAGRREFICGVYEKPGKTGTDS